MPRDLGSIKRSTLLPYMCCHRILEMQIEKHWILKFRKIWIVLLKNKVKQILQRQAMSHFYTFNMVLWTNWKWNTCLEYVNVSHWDVTFLLRLLLFTLVFGGGAQSSIRRGRGFGRGGLRTALNCGFIGRHGHVQHYRKEVDSNVSVKKVLNRGLQSATQVDLMTVIICTHFLSLMSREQKHGQAAVLRSRNNLLVYKAHYGLVVAFHTRSSLRQHKPVKWYRGNFIYSQSGRTALLMQTVLMGKWQCPGWWQQGDGAIEQGTMSYNNAPGKKRTLHLRRLMFWVPTKPCARVWQTSVCRRTTTTIMLLILC